MGYWKREYTERKGGKPLFKPEPKEGEAEEEAVSYPLPAIGPEAPALHPEDR